VLHNVNSDETIAAAGETAQELSKRFPLYAWKREAAAAMVS
jgi:hypothetical protein